MCEDVKDIMDRERNVFWFDVLKAWSIFNYDPKLNVETDQVLWYNSHIRVNGKIFLWQRCYAAGLIYVSQLFAGGEIISVRTALSSFNLSLMDFNSLVSAIPKEWRRSFRNSQLPIKTTYDWVVTKKNITNIVYRTLTTDESALVKKCELWQCELNDTMGLKVYLSHFRSLHCVTNVPKLRILPIPTSYKSVSFEHASLQVGHN